MIRSGILFTILMAAVLFLFTRRFENSNKQERDIAYYNDCLMRMYEDYEKGVPEETMETTYDCSIVFIYFYIYTISVFIKDIISKI